MERLRGRQFDPAGSRDTYTAHLAADVVHVFPGWGVTTDNELVLEAVESVEPWETFSIDDPTVVDLGGDAAALVYTARARRASQDEYVAAASQDEYVAAMTTVYRRTGSGWVLVIH